MPTNQPPSSDPAPPHRGKIAERLLPGGTDTPSNAANLPGASPETRGLVEGLHALKRMAQPAEIAQWALRLCEESNRYLTGQTIVVDGGLTSMR